MSEKEKFFIIEVSGCVGCEQCVGVCPVGALEVPACASSVVWDGELCMECEECIITCPVEALSSSLVVHIPRYGWPFLY